MPKFDELKRLLDEQMIDYQDLKNAVAISNLPIMIKCNGDGYFAVYGCGFSGQFEYGAEFVASAIDRKFREEGQTWTD